MNGDDKPDSSSEAPHEGEPSTDAAASADDSVDAGPETSGSETDESETCEAAPQEAQPEPTELELLSAERNQLLNDLQRVTAEFANFRKQTEKRNAQTVRQAAASLVEAILPVLDACEAAARQQVEGVEPIAAQLLGVLQARGLEVIDGAEPFDPNRHEAAISEPGDEDQTEPMVTEVLRTGYAFNGRVLRAAMVKVSG